MKSQTNLLAEEEGKLPWHVSIYLYSITSQHVIIWSFLVLLLYSSALWKATIGLAMCVCPRGIFDIHWSVLFQILFLEILLKSVH